MTPIRPPWIWPTYQTGSIERWHHHIKTSGVRDTLDPPVDDTHHGVAAVIGQNHNIDRWGVIGYTDSSFLRFIFSIERGGHRQVLFASSDWCLTSDDADKLMTVKEHHTLNCNWLVVVMDGGRQSSGTDPVAGQMDQLTQPVLQTDTHLIQ